VRVQNLTSTSAATLPAISLVPTIELSTATSDSTPANVSFTCYKAKREKKENHVTGGSELSVAGSVMTVALQIWLGFWTEIPSSLSAVNAFC